MQLITAKGIIKLQNFSRELQNLQSRLEQNELTDAAEIPISSEYSQQTLAALLTLCSELIDHNNYKYWKKNAEKLESFFDRFDNDMGNFSPACFDLLSLEMAKLYYNFLSNLKSTEDLTLTLRTGFSLFKNVDKLIGSVKNNTWQQISLYEFLANDLRMKSQRTISTLEDDIFNIITMTQQSLDSCDKGTIRHIIKNYEETISPLIEVFFAEPLSENALTGCTGTFVNDGSKSYFLGKIIGSEPMQISGEGITINPFENLDITAGQKGFLLQALILNERELFKKATQKDDSIVSINGILTAVITKFSESKYTILLEDFYNQTQEIKAKLTAYIKAGSSRLFGPLTQDPNKTQLAQKIISVIDNEFKTSIKEQNDPLFLTNYLANILRMLLTANLKHAFLVRNNTLSYGNLGEILTETLTKLYNFMSRLTYDVQPSIFYHCLSEEQKNIIPHFNLKVIHGEEKGEVIISPSVDNRENNILKSHI